MDSTESWSTAIGNLRKSKEALKKTLTAQKNRLASCRDDSVRESLKRVIEQLEVEITLVGQQIQEHIDSHPELAEQQQLLISIKGFKQ